MVGAFEGETRGTDGALYKAAGRPFYETRDCWQLLEHITVHQYHVTETADIKLGRRRMSVAQEKKRPPPAKGWSEESVRIRDADVLVRGEQLVQVLELALGNITSAAASSEVV